MARRVQGGDGQLDFVGEREAVAVAQRRRTSKSNVSAGLRWRVRAGRRGEVTGAREVIGVEMGVEHPGDPPAVLGGDLEVHVDVDRRVDHEGLVTGADHIGQAALAASTDLHDRGPRRPRRSTRSYTLPQAAMPPRRFATSQSASGEEIGAPGRTGRRTAHTTTTSSIARELVRPGRSAPWSGMLTAPGMAHSATSSGSRTSSTKGSLSSRTGRPTRRHQCPGTCACPCERQPIPP